MKNQKTLIALAVFVFSLSIGCILNTTSEYKFPNGTKLEYKVSNEMKQVITMMGQEQAFTMNANENMHISSLGLVDDNKFKIEFYIDNINITSDNSQLNFDNVDFSFITNKKSSALVSKKGDVSSVEAIDVIEFPQDPVTQSVMQQYNPAQIIMKFFLILPENELKVGETWSDSKTEKTDNADVEMSILTDYSFTVSEIVDYKGYSCFKITSTNKLTYLGQGAQMGYEFKTSGKGQGEGTYYFAQKEGILVGYETHSSSNINMDFTALEMTVPMTNSLSSKVELVK